VTDLPLNPARGVAKPMLFAEQPVPQRVQQFSAEPFLKWAGGKTQLLAQLDPFFPKTFKAYYEPFLGSAAVFFHLRRTRGPFLAWLGDSNTELVNCYEVVRDKVDDLIPLLRQHQRKHDAEHYYHIRQVEPGRIAKVERAGRFIYLNKTCYNGLYRVNTRGRFNVPIGSYKNPRVFNEVSLRAASAALQGTTLNYGDFSTVLDVAEEGDLVYFDPPYHTETSGFTGYAVHAVAALGGADFGADEHRRLAEVVKELHERGCHILVSNSDTEYIRHLYRGFTLHVVQARRPINSNGSGRGPIAELVITNQ